MLADTTHSVVRTEMNICKYTSNQYQNVPNVTFAVARFGYPKFHTTDRNLFTPSKEKQSRATADHVLSLSLKQTIYCNDRD